MHHEVEPLGRLLQLGHSERDRPTFEFDGADGDVPALWTIKARIALRSWLELTESLTGA
jgi:hypothetical protein